MISEEVWKWFNDGKVVFGCKTKELWDKLMVELEKQGHDISNAKGRYQIHEGEGYGIDNESGVLGWCEVEYYKNNYPQLVVKNVSAEDFGEPPVLTVPTDYPQPPQELISILRAIVTCEAIEKTYDIRLDIYGLYDKRNEYLAEWTSKFDTKL